MGSRGRLLAGFEGRSAQAPGMMRHGPFVGSNQVSAGRHLEMLSRPEFAENQMVSQEAEIEQLVGENRRLAGTHVTLREELISAQREIQKLKAHVRSIQTESDIQVRILLDKIAKMEGDIRAGETVKKDLQEAHKEAQSLVVARGELAAQIEKGSYELKKAHADLEKLPEMHAELDRLRQEHQRLRATFEYEKSLNIEQVGQMQGMEKNLIGMAREIEVLRAEVLNAGKRALVPSAVSSSFASHYEKPDPSYQPPSMQGNGPYVDSYGMSPVQMGGPYGNAASASASGPVSGVGSVPAWGGAYDPSAQARR